MGPSIGIPNNPSVHVPHMKSWPTHASSPPKHQFHPPPQYAQTQLPDHLPNQAHTINHATCCQTRNLHMQSSLSPTFGPGTPPTGMPSANPARVGAHSPSPFTRDKMFCDSQSSVSATNRSALVKSSVEVVPITTLDDSLPGHTCPRSPLESAHLAKGATIGDAGVAVSKEAIGEAGLALNSNHSIKVQCNPSFIGELAPKVDSKYCVALGDPIMDMIAFERGKLLEELGYERGGCSPVDFDEMALLQQMVDVQTRVPGGSAANVIKGIAGISHLQSWKCAFVGKVGDDAAGAEYARRLLDAGVTPFLAQSARGTPTAEAVSVVSSDGQRTMRPFLGAATEYTVADLPMAELRRCSLLHMEGYAMFRPEVARRAAETAKAAGALVSLDLSSFELVRGMREALLEFLHLVDLVFCNEDEAAALVQQERYIGCEGGVPEEVVREAMTLLSKHCRTVTVSRGKNGCITYGGQGRSASRSLVHVPACRVRAVDTTGAGDLFTSGFLSAYLAGEPLRVCGQRGCFMGSQVVQILGAELDEKSWEYVQETLPFLSTQNVDGPMIEEKVPEAMLSLLPPAVGMH